MKDNTGIPRETFEEKRHRERDEQSEQDVRPDEPADRGHDAPTPGKIPPRGWRDVLKRTVAQIKGDHLPLVAAGVAFFFLLGLFPALAAVVSIYGWAADPVTVAGHIDELAGILPQEAAALIHKQAERLAMDDSSAGLGAVISVILAVWAGSKAIKGMVQGLNIAYNEEETRRFVRKQGTYLGLTFAAVAAGILAILLIAIAPAVIDFFPFPQRLKTALLWLRWPVLLLLGMVVLATIYRFGPARKKAEWKWVSWGAAGATVLWLIASGLFSLYVSSFGNFNQTYGSLGAVVVLMMWLYLTAFLILMGAELDAEMEYQTRHDTTTGEDKPMGSRGAYVADHVASGS